ncbi:MetS family NSS transporter small subunit [candidate division KSB1 bacterium]|nr:MetS family NSS transporter small subunit [candidate division KSB1 bacterium]MCH8285830.1 MetS family NSS transporter small subunit [candidate division KSB1 bacterium]
MNTSAIVMLIVVGGIVWIGFIVSLRIALKREKGKNSADTE